MTLDEVFAAASIKAASLVPETSGYLALAIGDAGSRLPLALDERAVLLTTEGTVTLNRRGEVVSPRVAARAMRDMLGRLLAVSVGTMPGLAGAARPRDESDRGVDGVIEEIEAALIPVNRAAARRALARLSRETLKAKEAGRLKVRPAAKTAPPKAAPAQVAEPAAPPPRDRSPIPPPDLVGTPPAPSAPAAAEAAPRLSQHDLAPLLTGLADSVAPPPSAAIAPEPPDAPIVAPEIVAPAIVAPAIVAPPTIAAAPPAPARRSSTSPG
ncbi:MAG: hypothetical protein U0359_20035 [Byssovorax sp.]